VFRCWLRQVGALFLPLCFKVLLSITNLPMHIWSVQVIQATIGSACLIQEVVLASENKEDLSKYMTVAWVLHPDLIPIKVGCVVSEPVQPSVVGQPPVFLRMSEIMNTKCDTLQHRVFIQVIEVHDFNLPEGDSSGDSGLDSNDYDADGAPGFSSVTSSM
jgi:hypothetical protein